MAGGESDEQPNTVDESMLMGFSCLYFLKAKQSWLPPTAPNRFRRLRLRPVATALLAHRSSRRFQKKSMARSGRVVMCAGQGHQVVISCFFHFKGVGLLASSGQEYLLFVNEVFLN